MTLKISYLRLGVSDLAESERFYRDMLELPVERMGEEVCVRWPGLLLVLAANPPSARGKFHFGFRVESAAEVDRWAETLKAKGARVIAGPASQDGAYQMYLLDPDQYEIKIYSE